MITEIEPLSLKRLIDEGQRVSLIDVRQPEEHELVNIKGSVLVPMMEIEARLDELRELCSADRGEVVVFCRSGKRSATAIQYLRNAGFGKHLKNLRGGINAYAKEADTTLSPY